MQAAEPASECARVTRALKIVLLFLIVAVDDVPSSRLTMSEVNDLFEKPAAYAVTIQRGPETLRVTLTPRRMV